MGYLWAGQKEKLRVASKVAPTGSLWVVTSGYSMVGYWVEQRVVDLDKRMVVWTVDILVD